jgi:secreted trypsin-like serine protease
MPPSFRIEPHGRGDHPRGIMNPRLLILALATVCIGISGCGESSPDARFADRSTSITDGTVDGNRHPAVVLVIMDVGGSPAFRCSGTLIAPKVVLTAGHCAGEPGEFSGVRIFTESDVENGNNSYPFPGPNTIEATEWHAHPQFTESAFFLHDVGVIVLSKAVKLGAGQYGTLPAANQLEALQPSAATTFTSVGYGVQRINPVFLEAEKIRMFAQPHLIQVNGRQTGDFSMLLSNNASTGGTCFGDSGGPNYLGGSNVVAGVTSFARNGNCAGTGGVFRLDRQNVLDFVKKFLK